MRHSFEAGLSPNDFWDCTLQEVILYVEAARKRDNAAWQRSRFEAYTVYCSTAETKNRLSIYEFMPLPDDPTEKEVQRIKKQAAAMERKRTEREGKRLIAEAKKLGLLKID